MHGKNPAESCVAIKVLIIDTCFVHFIFTICLMHLPLEISKDAKLALFHLKKPNSQLIKDLPMLSFNEGEKKPTTN